MTPTPDDVLELTSRHRALERHLSTPAPPNHHPPNHTQREYRREHLSNTIRRCLRSRHHQRTPPPTKEEP